MSTENTATAYADRLAAQIEAAAASDAPFGYVNDWDHNTADSLAEVLDNESIPEDEREDYDADDLPGHWRKADGYDYLRDVLDIRYIVASDRSYRDAEICLGIGGPNVWIHTATRTLEVWWAFEHASRPLPASYVEALDEAAEEAWGTTA